MKSIHERFPPPAYLRRSSWRRTWGQSSQQGCTPPKSPLGSRPRSQTTPVSGSLLMEALALSLFRHCPNNLDILGTIFPKNHPGKHCDRLKVKKMTMKRFA